MRRWIGGGIVAAGLSTLAVAALVLPATGQELDLSAVPQADCGPGSQPETAQQGRVPAADYESGRADEPYTCNTELVAHHNTTGGFKVLRYVDANGTECAFYDSTLFFPFDFQTQASEGAGVVVLDMTDPANPVQTTTLTTPAMLSPHESLVLNQRRGLLAAVAGNAATYPGVVDVYDVSEDCTQPAVQSSTPVGFLGHESGFAPDGNTLYTSSIFTSVIAAIDVSDPAVPVTLWVENLSSHGMTVSDDGTRLYLTPLEVGMTGFPSGEFDSGISIVDVTSTQNRETGARPEIISELTWPEASIAQTAIPVTIDGAPYLVEIDEFINVRDFGNNDEGIPGAARIIDIADESAPRVVSNIRLEVHDPEIRTTDGILDDPGADRPYQGYAGHYCAVPTRTDPAIVACSFIVSGLRVFDIRDPEHPREIAYFNGPGNENTPPGINPEGAPYAMSAPAFVPERNEIWYSDSASGFWAVRLINHAWPTTTDGTPATDDTAPADSGTRDGVDAGPALPTTGAVAPAGVAVGGLALGLAALRRRQMS